MYKVYLYTSVPTREEIIDLERLLDKCLVFEDVDYVIPIQFGVPTIHLDGDALIYTEPQAARRQGYMFVAPRNHSVSGLLIHSNGWKIVNFFQPELEIEEREGKILISYKDYPICEYDPKLGMGKIVNKPVLIGIRTNELIVENTRYEWREWVKQVIFEVTKRYPIWKGKWLVQTSDPREAAEKLRSSFLERGIPAYIYYGDFRTYLQGLSMEYLTLDQSLNLRPPSGRTHSELSSALKSLGLGESPSI